MINLNNTDTICVTFYKNHHDYIVSMGLEKFTVKTQRIYLRGKEIIESLSDQ